jgi:hypothetical protein
VWIPSTIASTTRKPLKNRPDHGVIGTVDGDIGTVGGTVGGDIGTVGGQVDGDFGTVGGQAG